MPLDSHFWESYPSGNSDEDPRFDQALRALRNEDVRAALALLESLGNEGDDRAALCLGFVYESEGRSDSSNYASAELWYKRGLRSGPWPNAELGLARIYYYGLGQLKDPGKAEEHLWRAEPDSCPEAALMLATLLEDSSHRPRRNAALAKRFYQIASRASYPLAMVKLARIASSERRWREAFGYLVKAVRLIVQLRLNDPRDSKLIGFLPRQTKQ